MTPVVDVHTHVPPGYAPADSSAESARSFLDVCDRSGVDITWVFTTSGLSDPDPVHNDVVAQFCTEDAARLLPFCTVFPQQAGAVRELHRCVDELGVAGVKLHPWLQGFSPLDDGMDALGTALSRLRLPVVFHDGTPPNSSPLQIAYFAERHPDVPVILGHGGLHDLWTEALAAMHRVPNLWVVPSGTPPYGLRRMVQEIGTDRMLFGSDAGYGDSHWQPFQLQKVRELQLPQEAETAVLGGNALKILGEPAGTSGPGAAGEGTQT